MNIERRRKWIEEIERDISYEELLLQSPYDTLPLGAKDANCILRMAMMNRKRLLSLLRRVRRCPGCEGTGVIWPSEMIMRLGEFAGYHNVERECPTCGGTGRLR